MANPARLYRIEALIRTRGHVSFAALLAELEISPATLKRDLEYLRSRLGAPIEYDHALNAYRFAATGTGPTRPRHELPGVWFDEAELYSLLMAQQLLGSLDSEGLMNRHLQPLLDRIGHLLDSSSSSSGNSPGREKGEGHDTAAQLSRRVKIASTQRRPVPSRFFERVTSALLTRQRLHLHYLTRTRGQRSEREVSPQRLVHYRHTWYLDAWCHHTNALRRFALDAVEQATVLPVAALEVQLNEVAAAMDGGYGIFAGSAATPAKPLQWAVLRFDVQTASWASREEWHPAQQGRWLEDGGFEMKLPYADDTELVMDVLRHGAGVRVIAPASLVAKLRRALAEAAALYGEIDSGR